MVKGWVLCTRKTSALSHRDREDRDGNQACFRSGRGLYGQRHSPGSGILQLPGHDVRLELGKPGRRGGGHKEVALKLLDGERITRGEHDATLGNLKTTKAIGQAGDAELVIEAVTERAELKRDVLSRLDGIRPSHTIFGNQHLGYLHNLHSDRCYPTGQGGGHAFLLPRTPRAAIRYNGRPANFP